MERITISDIEPVAVGERSQRRGLAERLGTTDVALNHYRVAPGEGLPGGLHAHMDQEELFYLLAGALRFETMSGEVGVEAGEAIRFAPGEFQSGTNESASEAVVLAIGAPRETEDIRIPAACPDCGHATLRLDTEGELSFRCPDCASVYVPRGCPDCGHDDLRFTLGERSRPAVVCQDCGSTFEHPPLRQAE